MKKQLFNKTQAPPAGNKNYCCPKKKEKNTELFWNNARFWPTCLSGDKEFTGTFCVFLLQAQGIRRKVYWKTTVVVKILW